MHGLGVGVDEHEDEGTRFHDHTCMLLVLGSTNMRMRGHVLEQVLTLVIRTAVREHSESCSEGVHVDSFKVMSQPTIEVELTILKS